MNRTEKSKKNNSLTPRETEILNWIKEGKTSWEIGIILHISERTVNFHASSIKKKLDSNTRSQAVAKALNDKLIDF